MEDQLKNMVKKPSTLKREEILQQFKLEEDLGNFKNGDELKVIDDIKKSIMEGNQCCKVSKA